MNDKIERKLKELLPYIIIIGILFLLLPLFMGTKEGAATYIIQIGAFPLVSAGCAIHYAIKNKKTDLFICLLAPIFYALTALLYGMWRDSWYTVLIYMAAYFMCGYLGLMLSDYLKKDKDDKKPSAPKPVRKRPSIQPERVDVRKEEAPAQDFKAQDPEQDDSLNSSTTDDDIEAILNAIHSRKQQ